MDAFAQQILAQPLFVQIGFGVVAAAGIAQAVWFFVWLVEAKFFSRADRG
jgi:hypothetical protein